MLYSIYLYFSENPRCPVKAFKIYIRRRPTESLKPDSKFYFSVLLRYNNKNDYFDQENTNMWYSMVQYTTNGQE